jgi:type II secretory pathway component GspD/PulD (secretin)
MLVSKRDGWPMITIVAVCLTLLPMRPANAESRPDESASQPAHSDLVSCDFKGLPLVALAQFLSERTGRPFEVEEQITHQPVTLQLEPTPKESAVDVIAERLRSQGYKVVVSNEKVYISR